MPSGGRYLCGCLQILFVDNSDTVRARVAAGVFERIADWYGAAFSYVSKG